MAEGGAPITEETLARAEAEREARELHAEASTEQWHRLCTLRVGATWMSVQADRVEEICKLDEAVSVVPGAPAYVAGLMVLRGRPLALFDMGQYLGLAGGPDHGDMERRVLVVHAADMRVGCICDQIAGVERVADSALHAPDAVQGDRLAPHARHTFDRDGAMVVLIDIGGLLNAAKAS